MMNGWYDHSWSPAAWLAMGLMMLAFWGLIAVLVVYAIRNLGHRPVEDLRDPPAPADQALRILDERFARGEIDADEYDLRRGVLRSP
jgi:putative membrane protein